MESERIQGAIERHCSLRVPGRGRFGWVGGGSGGSRLEIENVR